MSFRLTALSLATGLFLTAQSVSADIVDQAWVDAREQWSAKGQGAAAGDPRDLAELELVYELCLEEDTCEELSPDGEPTPFQIGVASASVELGRLYETGQLAGDSFEQAQKFYALADHLGSPYGSHRLGMLYLNSNSSAYRSIADIFFERGLQRGVAASAIGLMTIAGRRGDDDGVIRFAEMGLSLNPSADDGAPLQSALRSRGRPVRARNIEAELAPMPDLTPIRRSSPDTVYASVSSRPEDQVAACAEISLELASDWQDFRRFDETLTQANSEFRRRQNEQNSAAPFIPPGRASDVVVEYFSNKNQELDALWDALNRANAQHSNWGNNLTRRQNDHNTRCNFAVSLPVYNAVCRGELGRSNYCQSIQF